MNPIAQQITFDLSHRPALGREDFLIAPSNQDAVNWVDRWPAWPGPALVIHGPAASGKTHLAAVWAERTGAQFISTANLGDKDAAAITQLAPHLVIDRVDPWLGDREMEVKLFHIYNIMREEGRHLLLTMRMSPAQIAFTLPDLSSRLRAAPAAMIQPPDDSLLASILVKLFNDRQLNVGQDVISYVVPRMERSFAAALALVEQADRIALAEKRNIAIPLMRQILLQRAEQED